MRLCTVDSAPRRTHMLDIAQMLLLERQMATQDKGGRGQTGHTLYAPGRLNLHQIRISAEPPYTHHSILQLCHNLEIAKPSRPAKILLVEPLDDR